MTDISILNIEADSADPWVDSADNSISEEEAQALLDTRSSEDWAWAEQIDFTSEEWSWLDQVDPETGKIQTDSAVFDWQKFSDSVLKTASSYAPLITKIWGVDSTSALTTLLSNLKTGTATTGTANTTSPATAQALLQLQQQIKNLSPSSTSSTSSAQDTKYLIFVAIAVGILALFKK